MSGPKSTNYRLESRIQRMIREDIACTQQCKACSDAIQAAMVAVNAQLAELQRQIDRLTEYADRAAVNQEKVREARMQLEQMEKTVQQMREQYQIENAKNVSGLVVTEASLATKRAKLSKLRNIQSKLDQTSRQAKTEAISAGRMVKERNAQIDQSIAKDLQGVSFFIADEQVKTSKRNTSVDIEKDKQELHAMLQQFVQDGLTSEVYQHVKQAMLELSRIVQASYLHTFKAVTLERIKKEVDECRLLLAKQQKEYSEQYSRYAALCELLSVSCKDFEQTNDGINQLKAEADAMEVVAAAQRERAYIAKCVDETMAEMGYKVIGSRDVRKKSGKHFRNELYTFNEGSAVNITYASDGQITMEVGGLSHGDRLPDANEAQQLTEDMDAFCSEFKVFEAKLKEKGVLVGERIQLLPPSFEYAQIINVDDYELRGEDGIQEIAVRDRDYGVSEKKVLRRDV